MDFMGYESERDLVAAAAESDEAKEKLRQFVLPAVQDAVRTYVVKWKAPMEAEDYLTVAAMSVFDHAFSVYCKHEENFDKYEGHFPLYFIWWARQAARKTFDKMQKENRT